MEDKDKAEGQLVDELAELRQLIAEEEALREADRVQVLTQSAGAAAHEINQPLSVIMGQTELLLEKLPFNDSHRHEIESIYKAGMRIDKIVQKMRQVKRYATKPYIRGVDIVDFNASAQET